MKSSLIIEQYHIHVGVAKDLPIAPLAMCKLLVDFCSSDIRSNTEVLVALGRGAVEESNGVE